MPVRKRRYQGVEGKVVQFIETSLGDDYRYVHVRFTDKTSFTLSLRSEILLHIAGLYDISTGDSRVIKEYVVPKRAR